MTLNLHTYPKARNFETAFLVCRGVPKKILRLADTNRDGVVSVEEMMNFIINITNPKSEWIQIRQKKKSYALLAYNSCRFLSYVTREFSQG